jgi:SAM-dependent methyltransferase
MRERSTPVQCNVCGATGRIFAAGFHQVYPQKNSEPLLLDWWECRTCGGWFVDPYPTAMMIESHWQTVSYNNPEYETTIAGYKEKISRRILQGLSRRTKSGCLLDFGCNFGQFLVTAREAGWSPSGFEPYAEAAEEARRKGFDVRCGWSLQEAGFADERFAAITANDVFGLVRDPFVTLRSFHRLLTPSGVLAMRLTNKRLMLGLVRALSAEGPVRDARISKILQAQFSSVKLSSLSRILRLIGFDRICIQPHATTAPWKILKYQSKAAYLAADIIYGLSCAKINLSPGVLLFARKST